MDWLIFDWFIKWLSDTVYWVFIAHNTNYDGAVDDDDKWMVVVNKKINKKITIKTSM